MLRYIKERGWNPEDDRFKVIDDNRWDDVTYVAIFLEEGKAAEYVREQNDKVRNERR